MVQFVLTKTGYIFRVSHLSESDANCFKSTKYLSKLVKDFLDEPSEKNSDSKVVRLPPGPTRGGYMVHRTPLSPDSGGSKEFRYPRKVMVSHPVAYLWD